MGQESGRFWGEISSSNHDFQRQDTELKLLTEINVESFKALFERLFFSEYTKRIDLELTSEKHKYNQAEYLAKN